MGVNTMDGWVAAVCAELGIDGPVDRDQILDLTRDVAHGVARPAAPLTAYLIGLAAGRSADHAGSTTAAVTQVKSLIAEWPAGPGD